MQCQCYQSSDHRLKLHSSSDALLHVSILHPPSPPNPPHPPPPTQVASLPVSPCVHCIPPSPRFSNLQKEKREEEKTGKGQDKPGNLLVHLVVPNDNLTLIRQTPSSSSRLKTPDSQPGNATPDQTQLCQSAARPSRTPVISIPVFVLFYSVRSFHSSLFHSHLSPLLPRPSGFPHITSPICVICMLVCACVCSLHSTLPQT